MITRRIASGRAGIFGLLLSLLLSITSQPSIAGEKIRVGVYDNPPLSVLADGRPPSGFVIELILQIAKEEGWDLEFVACRWEECNGLLAYGEIDILSPVSVSEGRARRYDFNRESLYVNWGQIVMAGEDDIKSPLDLDGMTIVAMSEDVHFADLKELVRRFDIDVRFLEVEDHASVLDWVANGPADAGLVSRSMDGAMLSDSSLIKSSVIFNPAEIRIALSPRNGQLVNAKRIQRIDYQLTRLKGDRNSLYYHLQKKWFPEEENIEIPNWVVAAFAFILVITLFLGVGFVILKREVQRQTGKVRELNDRFRAFMKNLPGIAYMKSADGRFIFVNPAWEKNNHLREESVVGKLAEEIWPERKVDNFQFEEQQALEQKKMIETVKIQPWDDRYWELICFPVEDAERDEVMLGAIGLDITEQKHIENEMTSLQRQQQLLLESAGDGIFGLSGVGRCTFINSSALNILGYQRQEVIGNRIHDLIQHSRIDGMSYPEQQSPIYHAYREGRSSRVDGEVFWHAEGRPVNVEYSAHPIHDKDYAGAVVVFRVRQ
ncbi:MAG: PAS domain-containing protein [Sedimenticola sp.]